MAQKAQSTPTNGDFPNIIAAEDELTTTASLDLFGKPISLRTVTIDGSGFTSKNYVKIYDALTVDPSSDVPDIKFPVANTKVVTLTVIDGLAFSTGFSIRSVTGSADTDTTSDASPGPGFFVGT